MGLTYNVYLNADKIFGCKNCKTHLASHDAIISRVFGPFSLLPIYTPHIQAKTMAELPGPTRQSLSLQRRREHHTSRSRRTEYDHRAARSKGYYLSAVQRDGGVEV